MLPLSRAGLGCAELVLQTAELMARIRTAEANVHRLVTGVNPEADDEDGGGDDDGAGRVDEEEQNSGMDSDDVDDKFHELEEAVAVLVADVHDLAVSFSCSHFLSSQIVDPRSQQLHSKLNFTGFVK